MNKDCRNTVFIFYIWRMLKKWYISTLIIILSLLGGVVSQQQITIPNQEIILQFTNTDVTPEDTQNTIAIVKKQLQNIGVSNIQVNKKENGKLKITYYSNIDVASIKETFLKEKNINLDLAFNSENKKPSKTPFDENTISYKLDVFEIQNSNDANWNLNGISVIELKSETNRFSNPNIYAFLNTIEINESYEKVAYATYFNSAETIYNTSHKIPEVRAGPLV